MRLFEAVRRVVARVRSSGGVKRAGVLTGLADGNYGHTMLRSGSIGKFVGQDALGNKYYEAYEGIASPVQTGRHRWVEYANRHNYNLTSVPPEWHGWLHHITDHCPANHKFLEAPFKIPAEVTKTGTLENYQPKGSWSQGPARRNWKKYTAWTG
mmetsp:Transcript_5708/g.19963  ORF Transcript_5708/g.19963 Transcript_5708/m.19963 type:complete len:154 (-) Transcript_5708:1227-1688(-)